MLSEVQKYNHSNKVRGLERLKKELMNPGKYRNKVRETYVTMAVFWDTGFNETIKLQ